MHTIAFKYKKQKSTVVPYYVFSLINKNLKIFCMFWQLIRIKIKINNIKIFHFRNFGNCYKLK